MTPPYRLGTDPSTDSLRPNPSTDSYVRTYPQTDRERDQAERDGCLLSNAQELQAQIYIVEWAHYSFVKVGVTRGDRYRTFTGRGGALVSLTNPMPLESALAQEAALHRAMRAAEWPQQFPCKEAAVPFLGHGGAGWTECYRMGVDGPHRAELIKIDELAARRRGA